MTHFPQKGRPAVVVEKKGRPAVVVEEGGPALYYIKNN